MAASVATVAGKQEVEELLAKYPELFDILADRSKVICKLTKHELPLNPTAVQNYINGKKFQLLLKKVKKPAVVQKIDDKYKEYFIPSKKSSSRLFCTLTRKEINKLPHEIEKYITGYKFLKAVARHREGKEKGIEELKNDEDTNKNGDNEMDEPVEEMPFFALSSDEEEEGDANIESGDDDDDDETGTTTTSDSRQNDNIELEETEKETGTVSSVLNLNDDKDSNDIENSEKHGKKRTLKHAKLKDRKTKKIKHGVA